MRVITRLPPFVIIITVTIVLSVLATDSTEGRNEGPIIGILTQETSWSGLYDFEYALRSHVVASYVKSIEASGGRAVPVFTNKTIDYYERMANRVNGILVPGGGSEFDFSYGIARSTSEMFRIAKRMNEAKDHFPILGICLGFELLLIASNGEKNCLTRCRCENVNLPLNLVPGMEEKSALFKEMPGNIRNILLNESVTANHHRQCMTMENFTSMNLDEFWNPITVNKDLDNLTFISVAESKFYPIVGLQFHPEKNVYEWERNGGAHSWSAIYSARYFYDWFVNECRKNKHEYGNKTALYDELIYNYNATFVGKLNQAVEQVYFFDE